MQNKGEVVRDKNKLLYLGWYVKKKGVYDLVDAVKILLEENDKIKLDLYGTKGTNELKQYVFKEGLEKNVQVNDWIDDHKKLYVLYKCTMLILPTYSEGIPNVILEAMATRTPIVATSVGGLKEILKDGENAIIAEVGNAQNLSQKIKMVLKDESLRNIITYNAYQEAKEEFNISLIKTKLGKVLNTTFEV